MRKKEENIFWIAYFELLEWKCTVFQNMRTIILVSRLL